MMSIDNQTIDPNDNMNRVLLIDLENCPDQIQHLQQNLAEFSHVMICYAQTGAKIPLEWLIPLSSAVNANKLRLFKMANGGKNAADFGICFFAGALMQQLPSNTHFVILSNDTDLDHVVNLLKSQGRSAERIGTRKEEKKPSPPPQSITESLNTAEPQNFTITSLLVTYCVHLMTHDKSRPAKKQTLINSIRSKFKDDPQAPEVIFELLLKHGIVTVTNEKVSYDDKKIKEIAHQS
jgi:hypothetical protein